MHVHLMIYYPLEISFNAPHYVSGFVCLPEQISSLEVHSFVLSADQLFDIVVIKHYDRLLHALLKYVIKCDSDR